MFQPTITATRPEMKSPLDRALSVFTDVRAGEGMTAVLMLINIFLLLVCYSVIKTVREPLILLGGGAEVRSYTAAGQALLLMGFVPLYSWFASRVNRVRLILGVTLFFVACIELFATAVAAGVPYVGVAFFVWVGIFNMSLVAQFWSFANDIYKKEAGDRLFPIIMIGMTAGAPLGSFIAGRLFRSGITPQLILQIAALLLSSSVFLYLWINRREVSRSATPATPLAAGSGFKLVIGNSYLRLIALLVVLLNVVNTTGEYLVAKMLTSHVHELALVNPGFNKQAYIGAFSGDYQFWVNVVAFLLQAFVTSRLVKYRGMRGALLALPLIALGGYSLVAAGVSFSVVRWIKTAENATDYSIMNTARQLLWLPTSREEKYKAKQAIDTFFVRGGDLLSAGVVFLGTGILHLTVDQFAMANVVLTLAWLGVAFLILNPIRSLPRLTLRPLAGTAALLIISGLMVTGTPSTASAQETREAQLAAAQAEKATHLLPYKPTTLEQRIERLDKRFLQPKSVYTFFGSVFEGGGLAVGPGFRTHFGDSGTLNTHAAWSIRNYKEFDAAAGLPTFANDRVRVELHGNWLDAPSVARFATGNDSTRESRSSYAYRTTTVGTSARIKAAKFFNVGASIDAIDTKTGTAPNGPTIADLNPSYRRTGVFAEFDWRSSPNYTRKGGLYRVEWSDFHQTNAGHSSFHRLDADARQFVPILRENWVIALRAAASMTDTASSQSVPYFMLPDLGGHAMLRGYSSFRFRDRNRLLLSGEYRWTAGPFVDMALFVDAGKVTEHRSGLDLNGLRTSTGLGISLHSLTATAARVEIARTKEGTSLLISFSPSF